VASAVVLFLIHLSAPLIVLTVVWIEAALAIAQGWRAVNGASERSNGAANGVRQRIVIALSLAAAIGAVWLVSAALTPSVGPSSPSLTYHHPAEKLAYLASPFYAFSLSQFAVAAGAYAIALYLFWMLYGRALGINSISISALAFVVLYLIFPNETVATSKLDLRWLIPASVLIFASPPAERGARPPLASKQRRGLTLVAAACLLNALLLWRDLRLADRRLDAYDAVLSTVRTSARVLPLVSVAGPRRFVFPELHYELWRNIAGGPIGPGLFNLRSGRPDEHLNLQFSHFILSNVPYDPAARGAGPELPLDWARIRRQYDYVVVTGADEALRAAAAEGAQEIYRRGDIILYRVTPSDADRPSSDDGSRSNGLPSLVSPPYGTSWLASVTCVVGARAGLLVSLGYAHPWTTLLSCHGLAHDDEWQ
jgi:hypothetical protein